MNDLGGMPHVTSQYHSLVGTTFATETTSELEILGLNGDTLGMDSGKVGVLEKTDKVCFGGLLQGEDGRRLEAEVGLVVLSDLTDETLEGELADEELSRLLVATDFTKSDCSGPEAVRLLHTRRGGDGRLTGSLCGELLTRGLATSRLAGSLLLTETSWVMLKDDVLKR